MPKWTVKATAALTTCTVMILAGPALGSDEENATCETPWANHGVSEVTIVYGIDEVVPAGEGPILPMDAERNTFEYRTEAFDFFYERFGVAFDASDPGVQFAFDDDGRIAVMQPVKFGVGSTHQVYAIDAQDIPQWRHRIPITSVALKDDGYFVFIGRNPDLTIGDEGFEVHGTYGGVDGVTLPPGTSLIFGQYRMFDGKNQLMDTLTYFSNTPAFAVVDAGAALYGEVQVISCDVESDLFGPGVVRAGTSRTVLPDGSNDLDWRYTLRFPGRIGDANQNGAHCKKVGALP